VRATTSPCCSTFVKLSSVFACVSLCVRVSECACVCVCDSAYVPSVCVYMCVDSPTNRKSSLTCATKFPLSRAFSFIPLF
jgi:hypothetical protein